MAGLRMDKLILVTVTLPRAGIEAIHAWAAEKRAAARALGLIPRALRKPGRNIKAACFRDKVERVRISIPSAAQPELIRLAKAMRKAAGLLPARKRVPPKKLGNAAPAPPPISLGPRPAAKVVWKPSMDDLLLTSWRNGTDLILTAEALGLDIDAIAARLVLLEEAESIAYVRREAISRRE